MRTNRSDFTTWVDDAVRAEFEGRGHWTSETWLDPFLAGVEQQPSALCVVDEQAALTRAQVLEAARRLVGYMARRGVTAGDVVTVAVPNWREFVVIHTAVGLLGAVLNPVLPRLGAPGYRHILQTSQSRMVFAAQSHHRESPVELCREAAVGLASVLDVVTVRSSHADHGAPSLEYNLLDARRRRGRIPRHRRCSRLGHRHVHLRDGVVAQGCRSLPPEHDVRAAHLHRIGAGPDDVGLRIHAVSGVSCVGPAVGIARRNSFSRTADPAGPLGPAGRT